MGVTGVGKTTIGTALARALSARFLDADDLHPRANVEKMARGEPLDDEDRAPWLAAVRTEIDAARSRGEPLVVACSALRATYRETLAAGGEVRFVHLVAPEGAIAERLAMRRDHFAGPALLPSQLATLEVPDDALVVDATAGIDAIVSTIVSAWAPRT